MNALLPSPAARRDRWALIAWTVAIWGTIPLARAIRDEVQGRWGDAVFLSVAAAVLAVVVVLGVRWAWQTRPSFDQNVVLLGVALAFGWMISERARIPSEAFHLVQYGVFGWLAVRALRHRFADAGVYLVTLVLGLVVGTVDEWLQWATPGRYWGWSDIQLNASAVALAVLALAGGVRDPALAGRPGRASRQAVRRWGTAACVFWALAVVATPDRLSAAAARWPALAGLLDNPSPITEYGYLHESPGVGHFHSRLTLAELQRADAGHAVSAPGGGAAQLAASDRADYMAFLRRVHPGQSAFLHEARVHLHRRDVYLGNWRAGGDPGRQRARATVAWREHQLLDRHFGRTVAAAGLALPATTVAALRADADPELAYTSPVSGDVLVRVRPRHLLGLLALVALALGLWGRYDEDRAPTAAT